MLKWALRLGADQLAGRVHERHEPREAGSGPAETMPRPSPSANVWKSCVITNAAGGGCAIGWRALSSTPTAHDRGPVPQRCLPDRRLDGPRPYPVVHARIGEDPLGPPARGAPGTRRRKAAQLRRRRIPPKEAMTGPLAVARLDVARLREQFPILGRELTRACRWSTLIRRPPRRSPPL